MSYPPPVMPGPGQHEPVEWAHQAAPPPARRPIWPWLLAIVVAAGVGAVGGWTAAASKRSEPVAASSSQAASASASQSSAPKTGATTKTLKLGVAQQFADDKFTWTVAALSHKRGDSVDSVQVRTCNRGKAKFVATPAAWMLSFSGGEELVDVHVTGGGLPSPPFVERELAPGKCVKGWISFEPPPSGESDGVEYRVDESVARWEW